MRNWTALENDIAPLQSQPCLWPASLSDTLQRRFSAHNQNVLEKLVMLLRLSINDEQKEMRLRQFLAMRWSVIGNSSMDYTLNPDFPANQACLKIAAFIAKKDESVCQIVMPSIKKIVGTGFSPDDIKSATEDSEEKFVAHHFLICLNSEELISILDLFSLARANTNYLFPTDDHAEPLFHFTAEDRERLRWVAGKESAAYFDALYAIHHAHDHQTASVGFALKAMQKALIKSSKKDNGSEEVANIAECRQPIFQFYQLWTALPVEIKHQIKEYKVHAATFSLESYLLCLFVHIKEYCPDIEISESDFERVCFERILPCTHQIGLQLEALLNHHPDLLNIALNDSLSPSDLPNADALQLLSQQLEAVLLSRLPSLGWDDQHAVDRIACFEILSQHCLDKKLLKKDIGALSAVVKTIEELTQALIVLPVEYWVCFFLALDKDFIANIFSRHNARASFTHLLTHLPLRHWLSFFHALTVTGYDQFMDASILGVMLYEFPESQWPVLIDAMNPMSNRVIVNGVDVFYLFVVTPVDYWDKIYTLFSKHIETIFENPAQLIRAFKMFRREVWPLIMQLFKKNISEHMKKYSFFLEMALQDLEPTERLSFLKHMFPYIENLSLSMESVVRILKLFSASQFSDVLFLIGPRHFNDIIKTDIDLVVFLNNFSESDRLILLVQMSKNIFTLQVGGGNLTYLLRRFPECEGALLRLFRKQLPQIMYSFLSTFSLCDGFERQISGEFISAFKFLSMKVLPVILSSKNMIHVSTGFYLRSFSMFHALPDPVWIVYQNFRKLEYSLMAGELTALEGVVEKIKVLNNFVCETDTGKIPHTIFYHDLLQVFGKDFFAYLDVYLSRFCGCNAANELSITVDTSPAALSLALDEDSGNNSSFSL